MYVNKYDESLSIIITAIIVPFQEYTGPPPQELETFLPKDQKNGSST